MPIVAVQFAAAPLAAWMSTKKYALLPEDSRNAVAHELSLVDGQVIDCADVLTCTCVKVEREITSGDCAVLLGER